MNTTNNFNIPTNGTNADEYENNAVNKSRIARNVALGAAGALGIGVAGAAVVNSGDGHTETVYENPDENLSVNDLAEGAEVSEKPEVAETTEYVHVERSAAPVEQAPAEPEITWDNTHEVYINGEKMGSIEEGTLDGHKFQLMDFDGDDRADVLAYDANNNGQYDDNEIVWLSEGENVRMGHASAQTTQEHHYVDFNELAYQDQGEIHNDFDDEKIGESYHGDFADNNPDYNNQADMNLSDDDVMYRADADIERYEPYEENVDAESDFLADAEASNDDFDSMMAGEEFLG